MPASGGEATAEAQLAAAHKTLLQTRDIQFDFQAFKAEPPDLDWLRPVLEVLQAIGPALQYIFWGGLILAALAILYFVLREVLPERWLRGRKTVVPVTDWRPDAGAARALLEDADSLAAAGRFEEAIHLLLFRSIDDLVARRPGAVKPALTARDIAELSVLPSGAREAFARLARAVERTFFGGRPAGADEFGAARADYEAFAFADGWR